MVTSSSLPWPFRARLTREHDGDSFWMLCDTGFGGRYEPELRLSGVHAPEIHPLQPGGSETTAYVNAWLSTKVRASQRTWPFHLEVVMTRTFEPQMDVTFTRYVTMVWAFDEVAAYLPATPPDELSLNYLVNTFLSGHPEWGGGD